jgi:hypothetical protein
MEKEFVPYELALELKQLGFDEPCFAYYDTGIFTFWYHSEQQPDLVLNCTAPTYSQAFRWFRERYQLVHEIQFDSGRIWIRYGYNSFVRALEVDSNNNEFYHTYEEAELACLQKLIEIVKTK